MFNFNSYLGRIVYILPGRIHHQSQLLCSHLSPRISIDTFFLKVTQILRSTLLSINTFLSSSNSFLTYNHNIVHFVLQFVLTLYTHNNGQNHTLPNHKFSSSNNCAIWAPNTELDIESLSSIFNIVL